MSWDDLTAALSAGARPQDLLSRARNLFDSTTSPPPSPPHPPNARALYRPPLLPGTSPV